MYLLITQSAIRTVHNMDQAAHPENTFQPRVDAPVSTQAEAESLRVQASVVYDLRDEFLRLRAAHIRQARARHIELLLELAEPLPLAYWDMGSLRNLVLDNLLSNALSHTATGGQVVLSVRQPDAYHLTLRVISSGAECTANAMSETDLYRNGSALQNMLLCVRTHKSTLRLIKDAHSSNTTFEIHLPLYALCMQ